MWGWILDLYCLDARSTLRSGKKKKIYTIANYPLVVNTPLKQELLIYPDIEIFLNISDLKMNLCMTVGFISYAFLLGHTGCPHTFQMIVNFEDFWDKHPNLNL